MLGDSTDNFYCEIGNPFKRNHFYRSYKSDKYFKMNIDYRQGIKEGRITEDFIEECRSKPNFSILYENKFPDEDAVDDKGYSSLIKESEYDRARGIVKPFGEPVMGVDVARGGGNYNVWVVRWSNYAKVVKRYTGDDLMTVCGDTVRLMEEYKVMAQNVFIDDTGCGGGVTDRLKEQQYGVRGVKVGESADNKEEYFNKRAEIYWRLKVWLNSGGILEKSNDWSDLLNIKYKVADSSGRIQIISKKELRSEGIESPDVSDAISLTFSMNTVYM
jgi:hypothetical protein